MMKEEANINLLGGRTMINQQHGTNVLQNKTEWRVGCGDKIRFWEDCW